MDNVNVFNFNFNGVNIPFEASLGNTNIMINATEMAKSVCKTREEYDRKRPSRWLRSQECKEYINALVNVQKVAIEDLIITTRGGSNYKQRPGTWMEKHVAVRYAQSLDPNFAVWVDYRIDEILTSGYSFMTQENGNLQTIISQLQAKENYVNDVINCASVNTYSTRDICMGLGLRISSYQFNNMLVDHDVAFRKGTGLYLKSPHCYMGLQKIVYETCPDGKKRANVRWTEAGKMWVYSRLKDWGVI